ncbi:hypothetical protein COOONC_27053 [Cooperia oncophora]
MSPFYRCQPVPRKNQVWQRIQKACGHSSVKKKVSNQVRINQLQQGNNEEFQSQISS